MPSARLRGLAGLAIAALTLGLGAVTAGPATAVGTASISGTLFSIAAPLSASVSLEQISPTSHRWEAVAQQDSAGSGAFSFTGLDAGKYRIFVDGGSADHYSGWYGFDSSGYLTPVGFDAKVISLTAGQAVSGLVLRSYVGSRYDGNLFKNIGGGALDGPVTPKLLYLDAGQRVELVHYDYTATSSYFEVGELPDGDYKLFFDDEGTDAAHNVDEWYNDSATEAGAAILTPSTYITHGIDAYFTQDAGTAMTPSALSITGDLRPGKSLTASHATWTPAQATYTYRWYLNGDPIPGQSAVALSANLTDAGDLVTVTVTGRAPGYRGATSTASVLVGPTFTDVPTNHAFSNEIEWAARYGITTGFPDGTYLPDASIERRAMAAFLFRLAGNPAYVAPTTASFPDVPVGSLFFREIEWLKSQNITTGNANGTFAPLEPVNRLAMAAFLYRTAGSPAFTPPTVATFSDVPVGSTFFKEIEWIKSVGITNGYPGPTYRPVEPVSRQAMAAFLYRLSGMLGAG